MSQKQTRRCDWCHMWSHSSKSHNYRGERVCYFCFLGDEYDNRVESGKIVLGPEDIADDN